MPDFDAMVAALKDVVDAREAEDAAYEARVEAERRLAEVVGVTRRDKDMGFDAEHTARERIVQRALGAQEPTGRLS